MRVMILGGTGFIGPCVVSHLSAWGHEVVVFHRRPTEIRLPADVKHLYGDWRWHLDDFRGDIEAFAPDVALYMVPLGESDARQVMAAFRGIARRVVGISSVDVYRAYGVLCGTEPGPAEPVPLTEEAPLRSKLYPYRADPPRPPEDPMRWADDYEKILAEKAIMGDPELPGTILRLPMVYGPGDYQHRLFPHLKRMDDRRPAILLGQAQSRWQVSRAFAENAGEAVALAVADGRAAGRIYNVAEPDALSESEWVRQIARAAGWEGEIAALPESLLPDHLREDANLEQHLSIDTARIRTELGYRESVTLEESLSRTVRWERDHPPQPFDPASFDYAAEDTALSAWGRGQAQ